MQAVNSLTAYFKNNGAPNQTSDPETYAVYEALTNPLSNLSTLCANYGTSGAAAIAAALEGSK